MTIRHRSILDNFKTKEDCYVDFSNALLNKNIEEIKKTLPLVPDHIFAPNKESKSNHYCVEFASLNGELDILKALLEDKRIGIENAVDLISLMMGATSSKSVIRYLVKEHLDDDDKYIAFSIALKNNKKYLVDTLFDKFFKEIEEDLHENTINFNIASFEDSNETTVYFLQKIKSLSDKKEMQEKVATNKSSSRKKNRLV